MAIIGSGWLVIQIGPLRLEGRECYLPGSHSPIRLGKNIFTDGWCYEGEPTLE
jgi:hypothetical protein